MTNEEEKILEEILDEENDITLEEAAEEAEELQEEDKTETPEEESAEEVRDIREELRELRQEVEQLRGGLRGVADPHMIQSHIDNFLAMLCGETPIDSNVRTSEEYWLKRLAEGEGGSVKKIYRHVVRLSASLARPVVIYTDSATSFTNSTFQQYLSDAGCVSEATGLTWFVIASATNNTIEVYTSVFSLNDTLRVGKTTFTYTISDGNIVISSANATSSIGVNSDTVTAIN